MSDPDLALIAGQVVAALLASSDLAPLGADAIVDVSEGDMDSLVQAAVAKCNYCLAVDLDSAQEDDCQSIAPFFNRVAFHVDVYRNVNLDGVTPADGGTGAGIQAWAMAAYVVRALKAYTLSGLATAFEVIADTQGIVNITSESNLAAGVRVLRCHFQTKAAMMGRDESSSSSSSSSSSTVGGTGAPDTTMQAGHTSLSSGATSFELDISALTAPVRYASATILAPTGGDRVQATWRPTSDLDKVFFDFDGAIPATGYAIYWSYNEPLP